MKQFKNRHNIKSTNNHPAEEHGKMAGERCVAERAGWALPAGVVSVSMGRWQVGVAGSD